MDARRPDRLRNRPTAVLIDLDNTLYPYAPAHAAAMSQTTAKAARLLGIEPPVFSEAAAAARDEVKTRIGTVAASHSRLLYFQRAIERLGLKSQPLLALDLEQTYWRTFLAASRLFPEAKALLDDIRAAGVAVALVTDLTTQIQFRKLVYWGLDHAFDHVVTSEEAGADKPGEAPYLLAKAKLGAAAERIWMVGDDPVADIEGSRRILGAATVQKRHEGVRIAVGEAGPDAVFDDFADLRRFFAETS
ncbi:MAG: HAD family hydrolase [Alphaproteobacteria bacterium]|nr:HAD family hydrolase [Alphaproteobacteria bacterium]